MKRYAVLALLCICRGEPVQSSQDNYSFYSYPEQSNPYYSDPSSQGNPYYPEQQGGNPYYTDYAEEAARANSNTSNQDKKSTPSKEASKPNAVRYGNGQLADQEKKSTPSQDAAQESEKADQQDTNQQKESGKEEDGDKNEQKAESKKDKNNKKEDKKEEEKPKSPHTFTANVSLVSDYRFRGISQTMRRPAIQGGFDYSHAGGGYLGTWASNVDGTTNFYNNTSMEWDFYGGYKGKMFPCRIPDLAFNVGLIYYYYPGGKTFSADSVHYNTGELYVELTYKWISVKYWQALTNYFGICSDNPPFNWKKNHASRPNGSSRGSNYIEANLTFNLLEKVCYPYLEGGKLFLLVHVGHQTVRNYEQLSYTDWRATLTQEFAWLNVFISYVGTNARHAYFDVPDHSYHPKKRHLGAQEVIVGAIRTF
ncbi:TorF family putative porin [Candidatus Protochlamydia phocaeensis]|uniref:TorF family putative porin n=1 Tax=Candidatus Protochlamydia phocaeensis TaxID=1414722 RepID=UPI0008389E9C|nr:TorF family putative porin [Candidatus Protochlamydia phocaeensis]